MKANKTNMSRQENNKKILNKVALVYLVLIGVKTLQTLSPLGSELDASGYAMNVIWVVMLYVYLKTKKKRIRKPKKNFDEVDENGIFDEEIKEGDYSITLDNRVPMQVIKIDEQSNSYTGLVIDENTNKKTGQYIKGRLTNIEKIYIEEDKEVIEL